MAKGKEDEAQKDYYPEEKVTIVFLIALVVLLIGGASKIASDIRFKKVNKARRKELSSMSWAGRQLLKEYHQLPESNRPYANIKAIVTALDIKYGTDKVGKHFVKEVYNRRANHGYGAREKVGSWAHDSCYDKCPFSDYVDLHKSFKEIREALAAQAHRLALAGASDALREATDLTTRLREEKELINQVTKELMG